MSETKLEDPLAAYVRATGFSDAKIGRLIDVNRWKISRARRGEFPLSIEEQVALEEVTGVSPAQWAEFYAKLVRARAPESPSAKKKSRAGLSAEEVA